MKFKKAVPQNPFVQSKVRSARAGRTRTVVSGSDDFYGAHSIETFSSASALGLTHEDANGFLDYPTSFRPANYWLGDTSVQVWAYEETYDDWQDTYGMDAVMVFYHSGHGGMDGNGVFQVPLGSAWDGRDWAFSNNMAFGNENLRYLFWSTCFSLRVSGPDNPVRTWWEPNKGGLRMLFGYETTSVDNPDYGKFFWEEWKKGKTFSRAFLDASWRISHDQVPVVMAVGANADEAINRLNNERGFSQEPVTKGWYQWQWIGTLPNRSFANRTAVPRKTNGIILSDKFADDKRIGKLASDSGVSRKHAGTLTLDANGNRMVSAGDVQVNVNRNGALNLHFGKANASNTSLLNENKAIKIAQRAINDLNLNRGIELKLGHIRHRFTCGGTLAGSGVIERPSTIETIVQFRQTYNGLESVNSDHGLIAVSIDNDGRIVNVYDSTKLVLGEVGKQTAKTASPRDPKSTSKADNADLQFEKKIDSATGGNGRMSSILRDVVGYDFSSRYGVVVRQKDVEVDLGNGLKKRYKVRVRLG